MVFEATLHHGEWNKQPNHVTRPDGSRLEYTPPEQVSSQLDKLIQLYLTYEYQDPIIRASWLHHGFVRIHPFEGQPSAACHALLARATGTIHWRGDFDWTGLRTTATAITRYDAHPWRMTAQEYLAALETGDSEALKGAPATSPWEPRLAEALTEHGRAIMEERLIPQLLNDLT